MCTYVCTYLPWFRHLYVHTFRMCIDVGIGHEQREHFESVCTYPASVKVEWCGQAAGLYLLTARSLTDQLVSLIGFWSRLCSLSPEVLCP